MGLQQLDIHMQKNMNFDSYFTSYTKINLKWILDLSGRPKTVKLPGENTKENLCGLGLSKSILVQRPKAETIKKNMDTI